MKVRFTAIIFLVGLAFSPSAWAQKICPFKGDFNFQKKELVLNFTPESAGSLTLTVNEASKDSYNLLVSIDHLKTRDLDISTQLKSLIAVLNNPDDASVRLSGEVLSQYTLINYKPVRELSGNFHFEDRVLYFDSLSVGGVNADGKMELFSPFKMDVSLHLREIQMEDFLKFWGAQEGLRSEGYVNGNIHVLGSIGNPFLQGRLESQDGFVDQLHFDSIVLNVAGAYPFIYLNDSSVSQSDGMAFSLEGPFDLDNRDHFGAEIAQLKKVPIVTQNAQSREWTLKRDAGSKDQEFKYIMRQEKENTISKQGSDLMGVQRSIKF